jgi:hypothetical protein
MDHVWAAQQLKVFQNIIDDFHRLSGYLAIELLEEDQVASYDGLIEEHGSYENIQDRLISLNPIMRDLINAAQAGTW